MLFRIPRNPLCVACRLLSIPLFPLILASSGALLANEPWRTNFESRLSAHKPELVIALTLNFPKGVEALPGTAASYALKLPFAGKEEGVLRLHVSNSFGGIPQGHIYARILTENETPWRKDVGSFASETLELPITKASTGESGIVRLEGFINRRVSNFPVEITYSDFSFSTDDGVSFVPIKPDVELPEYELLEVPPPHLHAAQRDAPEWLRESRALQPWGKTQTELIRNIDDWLPILKNQYHFNTVILAVPDGHRGIVRDREKEILSDEEFDGALAKFRGAGFHVLFYASLMHCGHASIWHEDFGDTATKLPELHPDWLQRDVHGGTIGRYGGRWLSPITPAFDYQVNYFFDRVERWQPDGLMLDNHGFHYSNKPANFTGYEAGADEAFFDFSNNHFGDGDWSLPGNSLADTYPAWLEWRNFAMADVTERFREEMRKTSSPILVSANIAFDYSRPALANDRVTRHLDAIVTENKVTSPPRLVAKVAFGRVISEDAPHWTYMGTFQPDNSTRLRDIDFIKDQFAAGMASGSLPWVVFYGFDGAESDEPSRNEIARQLKRWELLQTLQPWSAPSGDIIMVVSTRERTFTGGETIPPAAIALPSTGRPIRMIALEELPSTVLDTRQTLILENVTAMGAAEADAINAFAESGGTVIATRDSGWRDILGRWRSQDLLGQSGGDTEIQFVDGHEALMELALSETDPVISATVPFAWSQLFVDDNGLWLHFSLTCDAEAGDSLLLAEGLSGYSPTWFSFEDDSLISVEVENGSNRIKLAPDERYYLLRLSAKE